MTTRTIGALFLGLALAACSYLPSAPAPAQTDAGTAGRSAPVDSHQPSAVPGSSYFLAPGDVLQISVWGEEKLDLEVLVLPSSQISFPLVGELSTRGKTPDTLRDEIRDRLKVYIPNAEVTVSVKAPLGHAYHVVGQVNKPGEIVNSRNITVMQALSIAGGVTPFADEGGIIVLRRTSDGEVSFPFPYKDVIRGRSLDQDIVLKPGDVIVVPTAGLLF
ncbi:polysaccharide biosynthesis/export family protein [Phaeovibrio sulfidiphilus]|uniref:Polysaccharide biosynthesis/export family protein n=1 Tax=Phaeovibrio sulfidiphilus TaxID=1220600 RepID=A0A8J6YN70_9PROT|nr:polysaccharide biosynthesis/export family protein [Phaeovibrio sulfidiphilus]MBE1236954.1 polysaccharide biosynthesis/export family protein [Phaeovibrio sulfidiphilus]